MKTKAKIHFYFRFLFFFFWFLFLNFATAPLAHHSLVLVILTKTHHSNILHLQKGTHIETATIIIILLVSLVRSGTVLKTR